MSTNAFKPKILIIGAGLGGLTLGAILERAEIPYEIYEKATALKPLGSAISVGPPLMPMFTQLGIIDQIRAKGKVTKEGYMFNENMELLTHFDYSTGLVERFGWPTYIISRPALHNILLGLIPQEKIHLGKRVLSHVETGNGIIIRTSDNQTHHGNILVGADGAYSGVRQCLYEQLSKRGDLPTADKMPLKYSSICLVGQTRPVDEATFAHIDDDVCRLEFVIGEKRPVFTLTFTTSEQTVCWMVVQMLDEETSKVHNTFRASEWGPESAEAMCEEIADFPIRENMTMSDLIELTPKEVICKVMLEEKIFETWTDGRTVLIGDACHKMIPTRGLGGKAAMLDAVILANYLNTLTSNNLEDIEKALRAYKNDQYQHGKNAVADSTSSRNVTRQDFVGMLVRKALNSLPKWVLYMMAAKTGGYRPQISFLPPAEDNGTHHPTYQPSLEKTRLGLFRSDP